jgi:type VI secretion system protein ImpF
VGFTGENLMSRIRPDQPLVPSVLDRLLDAEPQVSREAPRNRTQVLRELKLAVRRDLENLLNSRRRCLPWPPGLKELKQSLVNYGIPDFLGTNPNDREEFCRTLQVLLRQYEPRFKTVSVTPLTNAEPLDRTLRFRIDALLLADPAPEPVVFDSLLEPASGTFVIKGGVS